MGAGDTGSRADSSTADLMNRGPRRSAAAAIAAARGLCRPSFSTTRWPQSLPAHQIAQLNLSMAGSAATITTANPGLTRTAQEGPPARVAQLLPEIPTR